MTFYKDGFLVIRNFVPKKQRDILLKHISKLSSPIMNDPQVNNTPSFYGDSVFTKLQLQLLPKLEKHTKLDLLKTYAYGRVYKKGDILSTKGETIGIHNGIINYTIGQRKGIRIARQEPFYVVSIDALKNTITVGNKDDLLVKKIFLKKLNLLKSFENNRDNFFVKVRSTGRLIKANIKINKNKAEVNLEENEEGISPGQACVFYSKNSLGDKVLGGGWITK